MIVFYSHHPARPRVYQMILKPSDPIPVFEENMINRSYMIYVGY